MSISTALTALAEDVEAAKSAIEAKGGTAPSGTADMADAIAAIPSGGITPSGKKLITDTSETDVAAFATAQVSSDTLLAENIKKNINILGVVGSFEGGGTPEWYKYIYNLNNLFNAGNTRIPIPAQSDVSMDLSECAALADIDGLFRFNFGNNSNYFKSIELKLPPQALSCYQTFMNAQGGNDQIKKIILPNGIKPTNAVGMFMYNRSLSEIDGNIDMSVCTKISEAPYNMFRLCSSLVTVRFVSTLNSAITSWNMADCAALSDASLISIANTLYIASTTATLTLHATPKGRLSTIMGTVADGVFTASESGTMTLENFITQTKGWTVA